MKINLAKLEKIVSTGEVRAIAYLAAATSILTAVSHVLPANASTTLGGVGLTIAAVERWLTTHNV